MTGLSVVMCNYNHAEYLPVSIEAILSQSYTDFELIVVEDGSSDNSLKVLKKYSDLDPRVKLYINENNMGVLQSANRGLSYAKGKYIYFAAADDRICKDFFKKTILLLDMHKEAGICSGLIHLIDEGGKDVGWMRSPILSKKDLYLNPKEASDKLRTIGSWFAGQTVMYRRACFEELNLNFNPELRHRSDHFVNYLVAAKYGACFYPEVKATYRLLSTGYAETAFANNELSRRSLHLLIELLRNEKYQAFLPLKTVKAIEGRALHEIEIREISQLLLENIKLIDRLFLANKSHDSDIKKLTLAVFKKIIHLYYIALKFYIYLMRVDGQLDWVFDRYKQFKFNKKYNKIISEKK